MQCGTPMMFEQTIRHLGTEKPASCHRAKRERKGINLNMGKCRKCGCQSFCFNPASFIRKLRCEIQHDHNDVAFVDAMFK